MHKSFRLQGQSFEYVNELIEFSETISEELYEFLSLWFDEKKTIIVKTSGSTGIPKPIAVNKRFMKNSAKATGAFFNLKEGTKALCCLSVNYIAGKMMIIRALELGWDLDFIEPVSNPLENAFNTYDFCAMVPMQVQASLWDLHLVKKLLIGGGVVSQALQKSLQNLSTECFASYGMTETVTHIAIKKLNNFLTVDNNIDKYEVFKSSLDALLNNAEVIRHGKKNTIDVRAELRSNYQLLPNITISKDDRGCLVIKAPLLSDDKVITNDIVKQHSSSEFEWLGRYDNVINSGGIKLHPEEIEKELSKIINQRFFVAGIANNVLGQKLILIVEGAVTNYDFKNLNLSRFQIPKQTYFVEKFVDTETKKIQRSKTLDLIKF